MQLDELNDFIHARKLAVISTALPGFSSLNWIRYSDFSSGRIEQSTFPQITLTPNPSTRR